jgi:hypothetical protein
MAASAVLHSGLQKAITLRLDTQQPAAPERMEDHWAFVIREMGLTEEQVGAARRWRVGFANARRSRWP